MDTKPIAIKQMTSMRINNEKELKDVNSDSGRSVRLSDNGSN
jgi:hypothetical protein